MTGRTLLSVTTLLAIAAVAGCGPGPEKPPTAQEAADFRGKTITPEQKKRGMAAAMGGVGGSNTQTAR